MNKVDGFVGGLRVPACISTRYEHHYWAIVIVGTGEKDRPFAVYVFSTHPIVPYESVTTTHVTFADAKWRFETFIAQIENRTMADPWTPDKSAKVPT